MYFLYSRFLLVIYFIHISAFLLVCPRTKLGAQRKGPLRSNSADSTLGGTPPTPAHLWIHLNCTRVPWDVDVRVFVDVRPCTSRRQCPLPSPLVILWKFFV